MYLVKSTFILFKPIKNTKGYKTSSRWKLETYLSSWTTKLVLDLMTSVS